MTAQEDRKSDDKHDTRMLIASLPSGSLTHPTLVSLNLASEISTENVIASLKLEDESFLCGNTILCVGGICFQTSMGTLRKTSQIASNGA